MKKEFTIDRRAQPAYILRCVVYDVNCMAVILKKRDEKHWRVWLNCSERRTTAPTLKAAIILWKLYR